MAPAFQRVETDRLHVFHRLENPCARATVDRTTDLFLTATALQRGHPPVPQVTPQSRWFVEHVQPFEPSLRAYLRSAAPRHADIDDLVQESYLRLFRVREGEEIRSAKALLFAIARNAVRDALREKMANREFSVTEMEALPVLDDASVAADIVSRREEHTLLAQAIRALPERCRQILILRKIHHLSQKEIAARLGISEHTVESLVSRGVRRCANYLGRHTDRE